MTGMTAQELREYVQVDSIHDGFRLEMANGLVVRCYSCTPGYFHEVYIESVHPLADGQPDLYRLSLLYGDDGINAFFATMGGIVNVLGIFE